MTRKQHVQVAQHYYLGYITDYGPTTREELAAAFDVNDGTAKRKLDGLVAQGKLVIVEEGHPQCLTVYDVPSPPRAQM